MNKALKDMLELLAEGKINRVSLSRLEAKEILLDLSYQKHYQELLSRTKAALDKVREKRRTGEPARSDVEEIEELVEEVLRWRIEDYNRQMNQEN